eukprot:1150959-Pelagomonas_calceolata.AAC.2
MACKNVSNNPIHNARHAVMSACGIRKRSDISAPTHCQSNPNRQLKVADWKSRDYTEGSCQVQDGKTVIGAGVYHPMRLKDLVQSNGAGITNNIVMGKPGLAAIAYSLTNCHGQPQLTSPTQKSNNANANGNILTDTGIPNGGPSRTPFYNIARLAREEARPSTYKSSSPTPNRIYFPELKDTSKSQMHAKHRTNDSENG